MIQNKDSSKRRRILLMYITRVSGHRQATLAIQECLRMLDSKVEVPTINGFGYTYPLLEKVINHAYMSVIKRTPQIWDFLYDNPNLVKKSESIKNYLHKTSHEKIARLMKRYQPETIVCTQAFPCGMMADYKREHNLKTKLIGVLTDFLPHSFWINEGVDYYIVPSADAKERLIQRGVNPDIIKVFGIPLRIKFATKLDRRVIARQLGLDPDLPTILIMGGGQGLGPIKSIFKSLVKIPIPIQIVILAGTNKKIVKKLQDKAQKTDKKVLVYEFANNVDELMEVATLIVTKPGGLTTSECLAKGLPMVIINPIPGQEMRNTDFLLKNGIGIRIDQTNDVGEEVEILLKSPDRLAAMSKAAYEHAHPQASLDIAKLILNYPDVRPNLQKVEALSVKQYV